MYHIIFNPEAGKNKKCKVVDTVTKVLESRNLPFELHTGETFGSVREMASSLTEKETAKLIVIGGDGTVHEALNGVHIERCEMGIIPAGTGNDFASAIGLPENVEEATKLIIDGTAKDTDFLEVGGVRCMNIAGLGIDVDVLNRYHAAKKRTKLTYFKSLIKSLFAYKGTEISFERDGKEETHNAFIATACNGVQFGGGIRICPPAITDDGLIDVVVVDYVKGLPVIKALLMLMKGKILQHKKANHFRVENIRFSSSDEMVMQLDGEIYKGLQFDVKVGRGLKIFRA